MIRVRISKGRASISKTMRGKSNVDTRLGEDIEGGRAMAYKNVVKMTNNESQHCGVNDGQE